jgi:NitT/TauT family transport system substrate-binding protein
MKRRNLAMTTLSAVALSLLSCVANAQPKEKVSLMLNWYLYSEHAPFFLGKEKGFFDAEGIDLDIQEGRGSGPTIQAVAAKSVPRTAIVAVGVLRLMLLLFILPP